MDCWVVDVKICHNNVSLIKTCSCKDIEQGLVAVENLEFKMLIQTTADEGALWHAAGAKELQDLVVIPVPVLVIALLCQIKEK